MKWILNQFINGGWHQKDFLIWAIQTLIGLSLAFWGIVMVFLLVNPNPTSVAEMEHGRWLICISSLITAPGLIMFFIGIDELLTLARKAK